MVPSPRPGSGSIPPYPSHLSSPTTTTSSPSTPTPITRSDPNPYPTTFVQADTTSFKQVVQMLTGSSETINSVKPNPNPNPNPNSNSIPPIKPTGSVKHKPSKLYERRNSLKSTLRISPLLSGFDHNTNSLSPSILDFPSLALSPVTPLISDPFTRSGSGIMVNKNAEDKAIADKGFYLHPSPASTTPRDSQPKLLPLFPVTSPRVSSSGSDGY